MGLISRIFSGGVGSVAGAAERIGGIFTPNAEASARRAGERARGAQQQYSAEFQSPERKNWFNAVIDGLNRLPRPMMAFGTIWLFVHAMRDPIAFGEKMVGLALMPDPLWWLLSAVVSFFFGARELQRGRDGRYVTPATAQEVQTAVQNIEAIRALRHDSPSVAADDTDTNSGDGDNAAIDEWRKAG